MPYRHDFLNYVLHAGYLRRNADRVGQAIGFRLRETLVPKL